MKSVNLLILSTMTVLFASCIENRIILSEMELASAKIYHDVEEITNARKDSVFRIDLSYKGLTKLPDIVLKCYNLYELNIEGNKIEQIPQELKTLENLTEINWGPGVIGGAHATGVDSASVEKIREERTAANLKQLELAYIYKQIGEAELANEILTNPSIWNSTIANVPSDCRGTFGRRIRPWEFSSHSYGFIPLKKAGDPDLINITTASNITPDLNLKNKPINVNLAYIYAYDYPGKGAHKAFFGFNAEPIGPTGVTVDKSFKFNRTFSVNEKDEPSLNSIPVFNGLGTGDEGIMVYCNVYNIGNKDDERLSKIFETSIKGLEILSVGTPAISVLSGISGEAVNLIKSSHSNIQIHKVELGLHFNNDGTNLQLSPGTYIVMANPKCIDGAVETFSWSDYQFKRSSGKVTRTDNKEVNRNYLVFTINPK